MPLTWPSVAVLGTVRLSADVTARTLNVPLPALEDRIDTSTGALDVGVLPVAVTTDACSALPPTENDKPRFFAWPGSDQIGRAHV